MASKRMFSQDITKSDAFLDMPLSTQSLYFHLNMEADDDGFVDAPKRIKRSVGASDDDLLILINKRFLIAFESGIVVIKHWLIHNTLKKDRYKPTVYIEEARLIQIKPNKAYTEYYGELVEGGRLLTSALTAPAGNQIGTDMVPDGNHSIGKSSIDKKRLVENRVEKSSVEGDYFKCGKYENVLLTDDQIESLKETLPFTYDKYIKRLSDFKHRTNANITSDYYTMLKWIDEDNAREKDILVGVNL